MRMARRRAKQLEHDRERGRNRNNNNEGSETGFCRKHQGQGMV